MQYVKDNSTKTSFFSDIMWWTILDGRYEKSQKMTTIGHKLFAEFILLLISLSNQN